MIFLIFNIFIYLLLAGLIGAAAGWLMRNLQAQRGEEEAARAVADAKSKLPQMESMLRSRDEQVAKLKIQFAEAGNELKAQTQALGTMEKENQLLQRKLARYKRDADASQSNAVIDFADVAHAQSAEPAQRADEGQLACMNEELEGLRERLRAAERDARWSAQELEAEQQKVRQMASERELQHRSLHVLNQQLELERNRRAAAG